jgi:uncharacterized protein with PIN domain
MTSGPLVVDTSALLAVLAKQRDEPLLFKGHDFTRTDLLAAV